MTDRARITTLVIAAVSAVAGFGAATWFLVRDHLTGSGISPKGLLTRLRRRGRLCLRATRQRHYRHDPM